MLQPQPHHQEQQKGCWEHQHWADWDRGCRDCEDCNIVLRKDLVVDREDLVVDREILRSVADVGSHRVEGSVVGGSHPASSHHHLAGDSRPGLFRSEGRLLDFAVAFPAGRQLGFVARERRGTGC